MKKCKGQSFPVELTTQELQEAEILIVKMIQEKYLSEEIARLKAGKQPKSTAIAKLMPIFDESDVLRVGGRISTSDLEERVKHVSDTWCVSDCVDVLRTCINAFVTRIVIILHTVYSNNAAIM